MNVSSRFDGGFYLQHASHIARCIYLPTTGFEGFGKARRRKIYPAGAIRVPFGAQYRDFAALDDAKEWFADMIATASGSECPPQGSTKVHGHSTLRQINRWADRPEVAGGADLYVQKCGDGFSCYGFDVADRKGRAVAKWCGHEFAEGLATGTVEHWDAFQAAMAAGAAHHAATSKRCPAELTPALAGLEGQRVEVTAPDGETRRFWVGESSGWMPCHLEILRRNSSGGCAVHLPEGATVRVVSTQRA
ncbi:hypothetical protein I5E68_09725 [Novosphingobium sp. YJ-S2-02]|uniref:Uncharacterized protein n=1 Tax=Novosphingobium aureum TaxID=2792964 RepID=A0A931HCE8_9SPHN|nr:hypothetical protein [Novosphingobium aureum]MBH0113224.1 hypothetical protein [Novosphingobium aureum]